MKEDFLYTYKETLMAQVVNKRDEVMLKAIQDYINERKLKYDENITALLIDEEQLNHILKLGIAEYERRKIELKTNNLEIESRNK
ncbi:MAG: hypothetical protein E7166_00440 [Firmicutes bacterium]|nr:hypothetical protein [Bacillota bacterium]